MCVFFFVFPGPLTCLLSLGSWNRSLHRPRRRLALFVTHPLSMSLIPPSIVIPFLEQSEQQRHSHSRISVRGTSREIAGPSAPLAPPKRLKLVGKASVSSIESTTGSLLVSDGFCQWAQDGRRLLKQLAGKTRGVTHCNSDTTKKTAAKALPGVKRRAAGKESPLHRSSKVPWIINWSPANRKRGWVGII